MGLYERLLGYDDAGAPVANGLKLNVHAFVAMLAERQRGQITQVAFRDAFGLVAEQAELSALVARVTDLVTPLTREEVEDVLYAAEGHIFYTSPATVKTRFGV